METLIRHLTLIIIGIIFISLTLKSSNYAEYFKLAYLILLVIAIFYIIYFKEINSLVKSKSLLFILRDSFCYIAIYYIIGKGIQKLKN